MLGDIAVIAMTIVILANGFIVTLTRGMIATGFKVAMTGAIATITNLPTPCF
jgi:hypothetical protein